MDGNIQLQILLKLNWTIKLNYNFICRTHLSRLNFFNLKFLPQQFYTFLLWKLIETHALMYSCMTSRHQEERLIWNCYLKKCKMQLINECFCVFHYETFSYPRWWFYANLQQSVIYKLFRGRHNDVVHAIADMKLFEI